MGSRGAGRWHLNCIDNPLLNQRFDFRHDSDCYLHRGLPRFRPLRNGSITIRWLKGSLTSVQPGFTSTAGCPCWMEPPLRNSWADKIIAVVAIYPFALMTYRSYNSGIMDIPRTLFVFQMMLFVCTMLIRRSAERVTTNLWYWAVAVVASYYNFLAATMLRGGVIVAPAWLINSLAILAIWIAIFARLSLGRNIGLLPAQRKIVTGGAYRYVRHPIYTAILLTSFSCALSCFSLINLLVMSVGCGFWVVKTFMEESFLSQDPEYASYMARVRWRWLPGIV